MNDTVQDSLSSDEVIELWGVTKRRLNYWERTNLVNSIKKEGKKAKFYDFINLVQIRIIIELRTRGVSLQAIRRAVSCLRLYSKFPDTPLIEYKVYTDGKDVLVSQNDKIWQPSTGQLELFECSFEAIFDEAGKHVEKPDDYKDLTLSQVYMVA